MVGKNIFTGLIDTGASISCVNKKFSKFCKLNVKNATSIQVFNGKQFKSEGTVNTSLNFGTYELNFDNVHVLENLKYDFIVGMPHIISLELRKREGYMDIHLNGSRIENDYFSTNFFLDSDLEIPGFTRVVAKIHSLDHLTPKLMLIHGRTTFSKKFQNVAMLDSLCDGDNTLIEIENQGSVPITLPKNFCVGSTSSITEINALIKMKDSEFEKRRHDEFRSKRRKKFDLHTEPQVNFGSHLTKNQISQIQKLLNKNSESFSSDKFDVGLIRDFRYELNLKNSDQSVFVPQRKIAPSKLLEVKKQFSNELFHGLIDSVSSTFNHPLVLVKKGDGSLRICSDLRKLNQNMIVERFPIPSIDYILDSIGRELSGAKADEVYIANFDIVAAYRALEVKESDKHKLAFSVGDSMYQHNRMCFGLSDAPATFSYLMRTILDGLECTYNYLDDIIICVKGFDRFLSVLDKLFNRLLSAGLLLKPEKCFIGLKEVPFLGHLISPSGVKIQPSKVKAIMNLQIPSNKDQLRSVLGSFNFHHNSVKDLYLILAPLFELLKKNRTYNWSKECSQAFKDAKFAISHATERRHRDPKLKLILSVDSSASGTGSVLFQSRNDTLEPLGYFSKTFSDVERRLPIRIRELLGICFSVRNWETTLIGEHFTVLNDHHSLQWLESTMCDALSIRSRNMLYYLSHFCFSFVHIKGSDPKNMTADMLSRSSEFKGLELSESDPFERHDYFRDLNMIEESDQGESCDGSFEPTFDPKLLSDLFEIFDIKDFFALQLEDEFIKSGVEKGKFTQTNTIIMFGNKIPIPESVCENIISLIHIRKGHLGINKLTDYISKYFHIKSTRSHVTNVVQACTDCVAVKNWPKLKGDDQKNPDHVTLPYQKCYIDIIDFGSHSEDGYRYGLTMLDHLTRHLDCVPLKDKTQKSATQGLIDMFLRWGIPDMCISDNGSEFCGEAFKMLREIFGINHSKISPFNPRANLVERAHREMKKFFKLFNVPLASWEKWLSIILFSYNSTIHSSLPQNLTPFQALFLRYPRDLLSSGLKVRHKNWLSQFPQLQKFQDMAKNELERLNLKLSPKRKPRFLKPNDKVLLWKPLPLGNSNKLHRFWAGPYRVIEKTSPGVYRLECMTTNRRLKRNIKFLRVIPPQAKLTLGSESTSDHETDWEDFENEIDLDGEQEAPPIPPKMTRTGRKITKPQRFRD